MTIGPSTFLRDEILNDLRNQNLYAALYNGVPARNGTGGTNVTTLIRAGGRLLIPATTSWAAISSVGTSRRTFNAIAIAFGNSVNTQQVTHTVLFDAATGGNCIQIISTPFIATAGAPVTFAIGAFIFDLP